MAKADSHVGLEVPSVKEVVAQLRAIKKEISHGDVSAEEPLEIRLQVESNGAWTVHYGDPGYDTDHHGYWGAGLLSGEESDAELTSIAKDLIGEVEESAAQDDGGDDDEDYDEFEGHGVTTRTEDGETVPAINVKPPPLFHRLPEKLQSAPQSVLDSTFEQRAEEWWQEDAPQQARIHLTAKVFPGARPDVRPAGRSSGHLVVFGLGDVSEWNERQIAAWERFEKSIKQSMKNAEQDWHRMIKDSL